MSEILVLFKCGHTRVVYGNESELACSCGEKEVARLEAPAPTFRGHALGPCAQTDLTLEPKAMPFKED